jgi:hypothetical protein
MVTKAELRQRIPPKAIQYRPPRTIPRGERLPAPTPTAEPIPIPTAEPTEPTYKPHELIYITLSQAHRLSRADREYLRKTYGEDWRKGGITVPKERVKEFVRKFGYAGIVSRTLRGRPSRAMAIRTAEQKFVTQVQAQAPKRFKPVYVEGRLVGMRDVIEKKSIPLSEFEKGYEYTVSTGILVPTKFSDKIKDYTSQYYSPKKISQSPILHSIHRIKEKAKEYLSFAKEKWKEAETWSYKHPIIRKPLTEEEITELRKQDFTLKKGVTQIEQIQTKLKEKFEGKESPFYTALPSGVVRFAYEVPKFAYTHPVMFTGILAAPVLLRALPLATKVKTAIEVGAGVGFGAAVTVPTAIKTYPIIKKGTGGERWGAVGELTAATTLAVLGIKGAKTKPKTETKVEWKPEVIKDTSKKIKPPSDRKTKNILKDLRGYDVSRPMTTGKKDIPKISDKQVIKSLKKFKESDRPVTLELKGISEARIESLARQEAKIRGINYDLLSNVEKNFLKGQIRAKIRSQPNLFIPKERKVTLDRYKEQFKQERLTEKAKELREAKEKAERKKIKSLIDVKAKSQPELFIPESQRLALERFKAKQPKPKIKPEVKLEPTTEAWIKGQIKARKLDIPEARRKALEKLHREKPVPKKEEWSEWITTPEGIKIKIQKSKLEQIKKRKELEYLTGKRDQIRQVLEKPKELPYKKGEVKVSFGFSRTCLIWSLLPVKYSNSFLFLICSNLLF